MLSAKITHVKGLQFVGDSSSGHEIVMDADSSVGGHNTGPRPMELLLLAAGGCSGMDVISILRKKKQEVTALEIYVKGEKAEDYPKKFTEIFLEFIVKGSNISEQAVKRAVELSMNKYCSVKATLEGTAKIHFTYRIMQD
jgi:putative redox protein